MKNLILIPLIVLICSCTSNTTETTETTESAATDYQVLGDSISTQVQHVLLSNVAAAMQDSGAAHAVKFCNIHAASITDSLSKVFNATIQRISLQNRNPENAAVTELDTEMLHRFAEAKTAGQPLKDTLITSGNQALYYKPIALGLPACLKCHGVPGKDIAAPTMAILKDKYPSDKAINYKAGDLRGAWKISFEK
jgi:cytochrome c553